MVLFLLELSSLNTTVPPSSRCSPDPGPQVRQPGLHGREHHPRPAGVPSPQERDGGAGGGLKR